MGHECGEESCCAAKSAECCCEEESKSMGKMMMDLANEAWSELMKEKMKAAYEKAVGDKMNKSSQASVEACMAYWNNKMKEQASCAEFEEKLKRAMM